MIASTPPKVPLLVRLRATAIHLAICLAVGGSLWLLLDRIWYPSPLFVAVGGRDLFLLLLAVDVVLGPAMTFIVFKNDKVKLRFDFWCIGIVQFVALAYGCYTLWQGRPVFVAALGHRFDVVQASEIADEDLLDSNSKLPLFGPKWVGTQVASDRKERERMLFSALAGKDYGSFPKYHIPLENMRTEILKKAAPIEELKKINPSQIEAIDAWLRANHREQDTVVYQGLKARAATMSVILDKNTASVVGVAPFEPWK